MVCLPQSSRLAIVHRQAALFLRLLQHPQHEPGIVGDGFVEQKPPFQALSADARKTRGHLLGGIGVLSEMAAHDVVHQQTGLRDQALTPVAFVDGHHHAEGVYQTGKLFEQHFALPHRLVGQLHIPLF